MRQSPITASEPAPAAPVGLPEYIPYVPRRRRLPKPIVVQCKPRDRRSERGERMLTVAQLIDSTTNKRLPMIRMRGEWLEQLGFTAGARIVVSEERGRLVLTIEGEE